MICRLDFYLSAMRKLRLAIVLPVLLLCTALPVSRWEKHVQGPLPPKREYPFVPTPTLIYKGINAPAALFKTFCIVYLPIYRVDHAPPTFLGVGVEEYLFLGGVIVLWYLVGTMLDGRRGINAPPKFEMTIVRVLINLLLVFMGTFLLWGGIRLIMDSGNTTNLLGNVLQDILFIAWSMALIFPSALSLLKGRWRSFPR